MKIKKEIYYYHFKLLYLPLLECGIELLTVPLNGDDEVVIIFSTLSKLIASKTN